MSVYSLRFLLLSIGAGLVFGLLTHQVGTLSAGPGPGAGTWRTPAAPLDYSQSADRLILQLRSGGLLPQPLRPDAPAEDMELSPEAADNILFLSSAIIDGVMTVQVRLPEGRIRSIRRGDTVSGDWTVIAATSRNVTLEKDGERRIVGRDSE